MLVIRRWILLALHASSQAGGGMLKHWRVLRFSPFSPFSLTLLQQYRYSFEVQVPLHAKRGSKMLRSRIIPRKPFVSPSWPEPWNPQPCTPLVPTHLQKGPIRLRWQASAPPKFAAQQHLGGRGLYQTQRFSRFFWMREENKEKYRACVLGLGL